MSPRPLAAATLFLLAGCSESDHDHGHDHAHGEEHGHEAPAAEAPVAEAATAPEAAPAHAAVAPEAAHLGPWTAQLTLTESGLKLTATDAEGAAVAPTGEVRVVLSPTGKEEQRVVLTAAEDGWTGEASGLDAPGFVAVISAEIEGNKETARVSWGEVPGVEAAPEQDEAHGHDGTGHGDDQDHGHGH